MIVSGTLREFENGKHNPGLGWSCMSCWGYWGRMDGEYREHDVQRRHGTVQRRVQDNSRFPQARFGLDLCAQEI